MAPHEVGLTAAQIDLSEVDPVLLSDGMELVRQEKTMSFRSAFKHHWRALAWSIGLSFALVMDGFDGSLVSAFMAQPGFQRKIGHFYPGKGKQGEDVWLIPGNIQTAVSLMTFPGNLLSYWFVGWASERWGNRKVYMGGMVGTMCVIFMYVFLQNIAMLLVATLLMGFCWGIFHTMTAGYAAELCPIRLRGLATSFISMAWGSGAFICSGVLRGSLAIEGNWSWRMPYAVQWAWPIPLFILAALAPESPYWLVRKGRFEDAKKSLQRTATPGYYDTRSVNGYLAFIKHTDEIERAEAKKGRFIEMFKGTNLRRTEIMLGIWAMQQWSGLSMTGYATQFFKQAGMSDNGAFSMNMIVTAMNIVGCACEFILINYVGRRPLLLWGNFSFVVCLMLIGILSCVPGTAAVKNAIGAFMVLVNLFFHIGNGPVIYTIAAELPASRLRQRSIALGRGFYAICGIVVSQLTPRMVSPIDWNWGSKAGFFYGGTALLVGIWAFFRLPETGGFSYAELEILFANRVPARKFTETRIHDEAVQGNTTFDEGEFDDEKKVGAEHIESVPQLH